MEMLQKRDELVISQTRPPGMLLVDVINRPAGERNHVKTLDGLITIGLGRLNLLIIGLHTSLDEVDIFYAKRQEGLLKPQKDAWKYWWRPRCQRRSNILLCVTRASGFYGSIRTKTDISFPRLSKSPRTRKMRRNQIKYMLKLIDGDVSRKNITQVMHRALRLPANDR